MRMGILRGCLRIMIIWLLQVVSHALHRGKLLQDNIQPNLLVSGVHLLQQDQQVVLDNGIVSVTIAVPTGHVTNITYKGSGNLLETKNAKDGRGYWNIVWNKPGAKQEMDQLLGTNYKVILQNEDQIEISFTTTWEVGNASVPLNVDKRFVMLRDSPGFYSYAVLERLKGWPAFTMGVARIAFKLDGNRFHYMAMSDERQRIMPMPEDRDKGKVLDYKEAVLLTNPSNPELKGEVDDKYLYSCDNKDNKVHGWVSSDLVPVGFWMITPSNEFKTGGPFKQDLTSHVGPTALSVFISPHYGGPGDLSLKFESTEYWKKVLGPVYIYLNSNIEAKTDPSILWNDAKKRMLKEVDSWPYSFPRSTDFLKSNQRGAVTGQLLVHEQLIDKQAVPAASAYVGLAPVGDTGSWQTENKGYQFWTQADHNGTFLIKNVVPGIYSFFAWVPGRIGDYKHETDITITPGSSAEAKNVIFEPPRKGETLWEIGIPDRTAAEFFIPDSSPEFKIHPYKESVEKFRQYGLWNRYKDLYPNKDLIFTIGASDYNKDWFFAHVTRNVGPNQYAATTWQIIFNLEKINRVGNYTLQLALASANGAELQVHFNDKNSTPFFTTGLIGRDNALARHGIHGLYHLFSISVPGTRFLVGNNTIFLTQSEIEGPFHEVMYDYIRLEGPTSF